MGLYLDKYVIVPHYHHYIKNGWLKYDHRVMYKKYTTPVLFGMWGNRKASTNKKCKENEATNGPFKTETKTRRNV